MIQKVKTWRNLLADYKETDSFRDCRAYVQQRRDQGVTIYPPKEDVFNAFRYCEFEDIRVVILGQDPYHGPNQAHGLCFSVTNGTPLPPSLLNICKELQADLDIPIPTSGDLSRWAKQGVFLLNTVMTVEQGQAHSHQNIGWEQFTDHVIDLISKHRDHVVFLLWGAAAQKKQLLIDQNKHTILKAPHPSPLSAHRGFMGCRHFSQTNVALSTHGQKTISW